MIVQREVLLNLHNYPQFSFSLHLANTNCLNSDVKRRDLIKRIRDEAKRRGLPFVVIDTRGKHDKLIFMEVRVPIPRHKEIATGKGESIMKLFEQYFGKNWWRNDKN